MNIGEVKSFWEKIYDARYFWLHLARIDLKNKFRRSKLGILWTCVNPLSLMIIMSTVFGVVFKQDIVTYAPYILSGILFWNIMSDSFISGSFSIIGSEPYIRQFNHPIMIYPLKAAITGIISFLISTISLGVIVLFINPLNCLMGYLLLIPALFIYFIFEWSATTLAAYIGTKYRDYPQLASLLLQAIWYLSPVFFQESMFESNEYLHMLFVFNPLTHLLKLIRAPFLEGKFPSLTNYLFSIGITAVLVLLAYRINKKNAKDIIFYI